MFKPRTVFPAIAQTTWFPGHMAAAMREVRQLLNTTDLVLEVRDARIPLSSRNPHFGGLLAGKPRVLVYNKADLTSEVDVQTLSSWEPGAQVILQNAKDPKAVSRLLATIKSFVKSGHSLSVSGARLLVVGMPNVGKSTLLNALRHVSLRRGKAARTGAQPGITRSTNSIFKVMEDPTAYIVDTPGIMVPFVPNAETMVKLGLVGCIKDGTVDLVVVADYLLYRLNLRDPNAYAGWCHPTNDILELLTAVATKSGRLKRGGEPDVDAAARQVVAGRWTSYTMMR
ncbi:Mitochondrial GTPase 1 [Savitreella phatthalungensis]